MGVQLPPPLVFHLEQPLPAKMHAACVMECGETLLTIILDIAYIARPERVVVKSIKVSRASL